MILFVGLITVTTILLCTSTVNGSPSPKKRGGSSGSSGSKSSSSGTSGSRPSSSWFGGSKKKSSFGKSPGSFGGGYKPSKSGISKKSFSNGKKWKKALAFGAGAYIGAKVLKKIGKAFKPKIFHFGGRDYDYNQWYGYSRIDGWVCRNDRDCEWIDQNLGCDDREFSINLINAPWPWKAELVGRCSCEDGFFFDQNNGSCNRFDEGLFRAIAGWLIGVIVVVVLVGLCLCCCCVFCVIKMLRN